MSRFVAAAVLVLAPASRVLADEDPFFTVQELPPLGGAASAAYAINDAGQVVGSAETEEGVLHAARWDGETVTDLGTLGGLAAIAFDINASGQITGLVTVDLFGLELPRAFRWTDGVVDDLAPLPLDSSSVGRAISADGRVVGTSVEFDLLRAVIWSATTPLDLGTINGPQADAWGSNDQGDIVGWSNNASTGYFGRRAFLSGGGSPLQDLGTLGGVWGWAHDVNELRQVVGESGRADGAVHAFLWQNDNMQDLGALTADAQHSRAQAINDATGVVGWSFLHPGDATRHAFLWQHGVMHDLNEVIPPGSGWVLRDAQDINNAGQVVGVGDLDGLERAFLLTPAEPPSCPADTNGDDTVNVQDLVAVIVAWGTSDPAADLNADGTVNVLDLLAVVLAWGSCV